MNFPSSMTTSESLYQTCLKTLSSHTTKASLGKAVFCVIAGISTSFVVSRIMKKSKKQREIAKLRELKESERTANFKLIRGQLRGKIEENAAEVLSMPFDVLQSKLQSRNISARAAVEAFIAKSLELTEEFNCVQEFLPQALVTADKLDNMVLLKGPLHGIPFCVNDDIDLRGHLPSFSCSVNLPPTTPSTESAVIVRILESHGAIPFCRTSTSVVCMSFGGRNPFYGEIRNPLNKKLSNGGSSCGTACLVRAGGAPFGIGTDRAGGARLPAHFTGISTLKPCRHRISRRGCVQHCVGTTSVPCLMSRRVNELIILYGLVMEKNQCQKFDAKAVPLPWNTQTITSKQKLRIGYFTSFPGNSPSGDTKDALRKAKYYLESCGHIVTNFEPPDDLKCQEVWTTLMKVHTHRHTLHDDDKYTFSGSNLNNNKQISPRILWVDEDQRVKNAFGGISAWQRIVGKLDHLPGRKSSKDRAIEHMHTTMNSDCDLWNTASLREQFVDEVLDSMNTINVDVVICPVFGHTATTPSILTKHGLLPGVYAFVWNLLDLPAGVVRVWREGGARLSEEYQDSVGMPIGIQVVGRPYAEEMVLRVMSELDEINDPLKV